MNTWHPRSYNELARDGAELLFRLYTSADVSFEECMTTIVNSYGKTFRYKIAKAFDRKIRKTLDKQKL